MTDNRKHWEIVWCVRLQFAASYIKYLSLQGREKVFAQRAYVPNGGSLEAWARKQIENQINIANQMIAEHGNPSTHALNVAQVYVAELEKAGCLSGNVQIVGTTRIDQE